MDKRGLLFIPDISGFTRFVNQTDIEHSRLIIQELLEVLINANNTGLAVSEIEGDAILFYKYGDIPALEAIYRQVQRMFCAFHERLMVYDQHRFCQCDACTSAIDLSLKIITHYGEFTGYTIRNFDKLIGKDVIVAHQLLKNDIEQHEYWMVTEPLTQGQPAGFAEWMKWSRSAKQMENGEINFHYTQLAQLKQEISPSYFTQLEMPQKINVVSVSREYNTDMIRLFHASGDFRYRSRWQQGVQMTTEATGHILPRIGMYYRQFSDKGETVIFSSSYSFSSDKIQFSETDKEKSQATYFTLDKLGENRVRLTLDYYLPEHAGRRWLFRIFQKNNMRSRMERSLEMLDSVWPEVRLPGEEAP